MEAETIFKMCVPDEHFSRIMELLKDAGKIGTYLTHKNGNRVRFYKKDGKVYADERKEDDSVLTQEVIPMSQVDDVKRQHNCFREELIKKLEKDFPEWTPEERDAHADILTEANECIKRLILSGVEPAVAHKIIESVLNDKEVIDNTAVSNNAEALAEVLRDRERLFGNPKDPNYGKDKDERVEESEKKIESETAHTEGVPIV